MHYSTDIRREVTVIIPALNEEATIGDVITQLRRVGLTSICVIDNGSTDATATRARSAGAQVVSEPARGYGRACLRGLANLPPETHWILFCDADGSDELDELPFMLAATARWDFVLGNRRASPAGRRAMTLPQNWGNALVATLLRWGWGVPYRDLGPLRLIRRRPLERMGMREAGFGWTVEMQIRAAEIGLRVKEVPVSYRSRQGGRSKISGTFRGTLRAGSRILITVARLYARRFFLRVAGSTGRRTDILDEPLIKGGQPHG